MYPYTFKIGPEIYKIVDLSNEIAQANGANYILLESMPLDKNTSRNIHLLYLTKEQNEFKLGRGHESQVRINDISVSRCHAIIKCKDDGFYIEDNTSKFGTIVLLKNKLRLKASHTMAVQVGRTVISFTIKFVQSEKEKLKSDIQKIIDSKKKDKTIPPPIMPKKPASNDDHATIGEGVPSLAIEQQNSSMGVPQHNNMFGNNNGNDADNLFPQ